MDETYRRDIYRWQKPPCQQKIENSQDRSVKDKTHIFGMVDRKDKIVARK